MIKFIEVDDLLTIRKDILRPNLSTLNDCRFPTDKLPGAFHLGLYLQGQLVCIASFHPQSYNKYTGNGFQLRGMATVEKYRGRGLGNQLLNFAIVYLRGQKVNYLWCNARKTALQFYLDMGFEIISSEFEVQGVGPHYVLYAKIA
ncbi:MAG: GNAT family N-acetyltransferase [Bacteroidota bacterium]|nr:GNAT family N-acetyltransferase [Bacteroidota bacterium]